MNTRFSNGINNIEWKFASISKCGECDLNILFKHIFRTNLNAYSLLSLIVTDCGPTCQINLQKI